MKKTVSLTLVALVVALFGFGSIGCSRDKAPIDGIGDFRFGKSTLADWGYPCNPPRNGTTFCQNNPLEAAHSVSLGGQNALAGALFGGTAKDAPLVEIELYVEQCKPQDLGDWLTKTFGKPSGTTETGMFWKQKIVFIAAKLPKAGECKVNFVEVKNTARVTKLQNRS